ncbi:hypothetical protein DPMN_174411 [Dreissena polymorpha]|uniref:Uncharacterized protein n=1 Tax=Dreissena polymorpha TaxID=45954 RepID=A0A9D4IF44_DREPO|nr:hypothetical protein DPMN_174411 [Dreissena polymorpha]
MEVGMDLGSLASIVSAVGGSVAGSGVRAGRSRLARQELRLCRDDGFCAMGTATIRNLHSRRTYDGLTLTVGLFTPSLLKTNTQQPYAIHKHDPHSTPSYQPSNPLFSTHSER